MSTLADEVGDAVLKVLGGSLDLRDGDARRQYGRAALAAVRAHLDRDEFKLRVARTIDDHTDGWFWYDEAGNCVGAEAGDAVIAIIKTELG